MTRILSVEDDPDMQRLIGTVLFGIGYEMHYSWNGQDGYEKVLMLHPDLILLDLMLPIMSGVEVLKKVRETPACAAVAVIVVSAYGGESGALERSITDLGVEGYIRKPFRADDLVGSVKGVLSQFPNAHSPKKEKVRRKEAFKGAVRADPEFRTVWLNGRLVATLSPKSFEMLERLMKSSGPVSKEHLMKDLSYESVDALKKAVQRLREELGDLHKHRIWTVPEGYELKVADYQESTSHPLIR